MNAIDFVTALQKELGMDENSIESPKQSPRKKTFNQFGIHIDPSTNSQSSSSEYPKLQKWFNVANLVKRFNEKVRSRSNSPILRIDSMQQHNDRKSSVVV